MPSRACIGRGIAYLILTSLSMSKANNFVFSGGCDYLWFPFMAIDLRLDICISSSIGLRW